ncbi:hypothetical protein T440DRAFT_547209 [Plenodomus tracheiphilus IPT5]|uniref:Uncharacterized protein n=1 Tax=Plenodomus tracheiphilus IPT5 TaxID=1408161 RepID=A0A6A7ANB0_9PLEO|nr:hypothetical protein T440DRAFT_547209 [Plenodomus tracheiphilus IPT5]
METSEERLQKRLWTDKTILVPPESYKFAADSCMSSRVVDLIVCLNSKATEDPIIRQNLEAKVKDFPGACLEVLLVIFCRGEMKMLGQYAFSNDAPSHREWFLIFIRLDVRKGRNSTRSTVSVLLPHHQRGDFDVTIDRGSGTPYLREKQLHEGLSAKVYAVTVAAKHYQREKAEISESEKAFSERLLKHDNIATAIGSVVHGSGCLDMRTTNLDGHGAIERSSITLGKRNLALSGENHDCFFEQRGKWRKKKVNEAVTGTIEDSIEYCKITGDSVTERCLKFIRDEMLRPEPGDRGSADDLHIKLAASYNEQHTVKSISIEHDRELAEVRALQSEMVYSHSQEKP